MAPPYLEALFSVIVPPFTFKIPPSPTLKAPPDAPIFFLIVPSYKLNCPLTLATGASPSALTFILLFVIVPLYILQITRVASPSPPIASIPYSVTQSWILILLIVRIAFALSP